MTTVARPQPAPRGAPQTPPAEGPVRMIRVTANLLPDTVLAARRLTKLKRRLGVGLLGLIGVLVLGYGWSWWQTKSAQDDLSSARHHNQQMHSQMSAFAPLLAAQSRQQAVTGTLGTVMALDLPWRDLLGRIEAKTGSSIQITNLSGTVGATGSTPTTGLGVLNHTGLRAIGTLSITGNAVDSKSVAAFVDALSATKGVAAPLPTNVSGGKGAGVFTVNLLVTSDALGGRFNSALPIVPTTGGH